ncbi:hypothetical protein KGF56_003269 [Candida oxycetoniae]|uniref:Uncharacterized protein n=1 Tax=Candida oxycetoniae TaxID=497107 RepID=A0AAI9SW50_9ASCO|nr:uncharacterized protein KGF56_003269 [Candida oxycetoniae]KAI3403839.2 hypothetical protein KGF56_003269 [Candida oxycetoniae]
MDLLLEDQIGDLLESSYLEQFDPIFGISDSVTITTKNMTNITSDNVNLDFDEDFQLLNQFDFSFVQTWPISSYVTQPPTMTKTRTNSISSSINIPSPIKSTSCSEYHHTRNHSLRSPLQVPDDFSFFPNDSSLSLSLSSSSPSKPKHAQRSKSFDATRSNRGQDIFSYNYSNNLKSSSRHRICKSSANSPQMKPPLKPSVTIASINTLAKFQKLSPPSASNSRNKRKVGNPFYKPMINNSINSNSSNSNSSNNNNNNSSTATIIINNNNNSTENTATNSDNLNSSSTICSTLPEFNIPSNDEMLNNLPIPTNLEYKGPGLTASFAKLENCLVLESLFEGT